MLQYSVVILPHFSCESQFSPSFPVKVYKQFKDKRLFNAYCFLKYGTKLFQCCLTFQGPCGIVINVAEMFNCKFKSQVYGHLYKLIEMRAWKECIRERFILCSNGTRIPDCNDRPNKNIVFMLCIK